MNNADLTDRLAADRNITKAKAKEVIDLVFTAIAEAAGRGEEISLNGFGKFKVHGRAAGAVLGRSAATGRKVLKPATKGASITIKEASRAAKYARANSK